MPCGLDRVGEVGVDGIDHQRRRRSARTAGRHRRPTTRGRARSSCGRPDPSAPRRRRSARWPRPIDRRAARIGSTSASARIGPIDTIGLDGAITMQSAAFSTSSSPGARPASARADEAHCRHGHAVAQLDEVLLEGDVAAVGEGDDGGDRVVAHRNQSLPHAPRRADLGGHFRQRGAFGESGGAVEVGGQITVAEVEPRRRGARPAGRTSAYRCSASIARHDSSASPQPRSGSIASASV